MWRALIASTSDKFSSVGIRDKYITKFGERSLWAWLQNGSVLVSLGCRTITRYRRQGHLNNKSNLFPHHFGSSRSTSSSLGFCWDLSPCWAGGRLLTVLSRGLFSVCLQTESVPVSEFRGFFLFLNGHQSIRSPCDLTTYLLRSSIFPNGHIAG